MKTLSEALEEALIEYENAISIYRICKNCKWWTNTDITGYSCKNERVNCFREDETFGCNLWEERDE